MPFLLCSGGKGGVRYGRKKRKGKEKKRKEKKREELRKTNSILPLRLFPNKQ